MQHKLAGAAAGTAALAAAMLALALAGAGSSAPAPTLFAPGKELDRVRLGMSRGEVERTWGHRHGVCRGCPRRTWYFNDRRFEPQGTAVAFADGRVVHAYTVWQPPAWRTPEGLSLGDPAGRVHDLYGPLREQSCDGYVALVLAGDGADSVFYVHRDGVWGFGLKRPRVSACV